MRNKAVFFDRDGIINRELDRYVEHLGEFEILDGVGEALKRIKSKGYYLILVTNQGGIAKGLYSHDTVNEIHQSLQEYLKGYDAEFDELYYSPHHPDFGNSLNRKPGSMMLERGLARFDIDPNQSYLIGDKERDIQAAEAVGVKGILVDPNTDLRTLLHLIP